MLSAVVSDPYSGKKVVVLGGRLNTSLPGVGVGVGIGNFCMMDKEKPVNAIIKNIGIILRSFLEAIECLLVVIGVVVVVEDERVCPELQKQCSDFMTKLFRISNLESD